MLHATKLEQIVIKWINGGYGSESAIVIPINFAHNDVSTNEIINEYARQLSQEFKAWIDSETDYGTFLFDILEAVGDTVWWRAIAEKLYLERMDS